MPSILQQLLLNDFPDNDGLFQAEREAIVDALHYCMYADKRIELVESKIIYDWQETLSWSNKLPFSTYEPRSIAAARMALESDENRKEFIASIVSRLTSKHAGETLMRLCRKLADADGKRSENEWAFIEELNRATTAAQRQ